MPGLLVACAIVSVTPLLDAASAFAERPKMTLAELVERARANAVTVRAASSQVAIRRTQRSEAIRNWAPTGELIAALTGTPGVQCRGPNGESELPMRTANCASTVGVDPKNLFSFNVGGFGPAGLLLSVTQPIYTFGKIEYGTRAAEKAIEAEEGRVNMARDDAALNVARAYWGIKAARTAYDSIVDGRNELADYQKKIEDDLEQDTPHYDLNDLSRMKVALSQIEELVSDFEARIAIAHDGLDAAVGEPADVDDAEFDPLALPEADPRGIPAMVAREQSRGATAASTGVAGSAYSTT